MRAGALPGGDEVCHGYHAWNDNECVRCGFLDLVPHDGLTDKPIDPDCRYGKHDACPGWTWDTKRDTEASCACTCHTTEKEAL